MKFLDNTYFIGGVIQNNLDGTKKVAYVSKYKDYGPFDPPCEYLR